MKRKSTRDKILAFGSPKNGKRKDKPYMPPWASRAITEQLDQVDEAIFAIDQANRTPEGYFSRARHRTA